MAVQKRNWYSNVKLIFLILFLLMFIGYVIRDYRLGNSMVGPLIFGGFLAAIAWIFKPWQTGSDEGTKPRPPKPPSTYLLTPLLMQDTTAVADTCDGMISCHPIATGVIALAVAAVFYGIWRYNRSRP